MKKPTIIILLLFITLCSCSNMFNSMVLPNQCKKCEVINLNTNEVLFSNEGCGGDNTKLEEEAKIQAYDLSRFNSLCDLEVRCDSWRKDPEPK